MSGSRTRSGFAGTEGGPGRTTAPTLLGHELHGRAEARPEPETPPPADPPVARADAPTEAVPPLESLPSGKSHLPAKAQVFGRWNSEGELQAHTPAPMPAWVDHPGGDDER